MHRSLIAVLVVVLLAVACGGSSSGQASGATNDGAPAFDGTTVDGQALVSADYAGQDVILWFWAPW